MGSVNVRVRLLGPVRVETDGRVQEPPPRTHGLLAVLALEPGGYERGRLAELVAPGAGSSAARRRLSRLLWLLRDAVPALPVTVGPRWVALDADHLTVDVAEVEELAASDTPQALEAAFERVGGPLCPDVDLPWVSEQRERVRTLAERIAARVAEDRAGRGEMAAARDAADWLLAHDPGSTTALELRLRADRVLGRRQEADEAVAAWEQAQGATEASAPPVVRDLLAAIRREATMPEVPREDAAPEEWQLEARLAGARGDTSGQRRALAMLRNASSLGRITRAELRIAEVDAALDREEYPLADRLLAMGRDDPDTVALQIRRCRVALAHGALDQAMEEASDALLRAYCDRRELARLEALLALAAVMSARGEGREALGAAAQAQEIAERAGRLDAVLEADLVAGREEARQGRFKAAATRLVETRARAAGSGFARLEGEALHELARARCRLGELDAADGLHREAREHWRRLSLPVREAVACGEHAHTRARAAQHEEAHELAERSEELATGAGASSAAGWACLSSGLVRLFEGDTEHADRAFARAEAHAGKDADDSLTAALAVHRGFAAYLRGESSSALAEVTSAREWYERRDELEQLPVMLVVEALARLKLGELHAARVATERALTEVAQLGAGDLAVWVHYAHGRVLESAGDDENARVWFGHGIDQLHAMACAAGVSAEEFATRDPLTRGLGVAATAAGVANVPATWVTGRPAGVA
ncbi:hypothetical protein ER308_11685 [Egibacter rhizosphaerae]|uniref:Bacterial transcriptional activator domain-containing protein n=1 Tax=Egibacter rhizosphaerae TaxID=1670831 RepID=A0A411YG12_9ACTN|nr:hypothetical protein [Egibacter rhizosphaerae]QBI20158.1 hypothetical protein ER308_11685 [Egibacter rhizosphaerae]